MNGEAGYGVGPGLEDRSMRKALPSTMFIDTEQSRLSMLRNWVLDHEVTEIEMNERQFWNFAHLQPVAEKPWITFMGRLVRVPNMPEAAQKNLGIFDKLGPGII